MNTQTQLLLALWAEARTRLTNQLATLPSVDLQKRLGASPNSAGFLVRHIADVELLFAKNVFGLSDLKVSAKTVISQKDTGEWTDLTELQQYLQEAANALQAAIEKQTEADWGQLIATKEFGTKTKAEALGRIVSHTAYHAGQLALVVKYGVVKN